MSLNYQTIDKELYPYEIEELEKQVEVEICWALKDHSFKELNKAYEKAMNLWDYCKEDSLKYLSILNKINNNWLGKHITTFYVHRRTIWLNNAPNAMNLWYMPMMGILILFGIVMNVIYGQRDNYTGL